MKCATCQFENPPGMKFCVECGTQLFQSCPQCGAEMLPSYKFCGECGADLKQAMGSGPPRRLSPAPRSAAPAPTQATSAPRPTAEPAAVEIPAQLPQPAGEGERKQISVLVCNLVPPADDAKPLTADEQHTLLNQFFELAQPEVERFGGTIHRFTSQGFMALFGAPVAWEDHPHRAVLAALGLMEKVAPRQEAWLAVSIGIDTGSVVVGGVGGMAVGEAPLRATALEQHAGPQEIWVSARTGRQISGDKVLEAVAPITLDGQSIEVFRVRTEQGADLTTSHRRGAVGFSPFVGREHEVATLERLRDLAAQGQGQVIGLVGEAGSGKSRLLHEFHRRTQSKQNVTSLRGHCLSYGSGIPYLPLVDMVRSASRLSESDDAASIIAKLRRYWIGMGADLANLPYFLRLLGIEQGTEALEEVEPQAIQARTFAAIRRLILDAAKQSLVILEIEDLHWIDDTSAEFLDSLLEIMAAARLLVIVTYRSGDPPRWLDKSFATQIPMRRLTEEDSRHLVDSLLERSEQSFDVDEALLAKADGNPLFLEELTRSLIEVGSDGEGVPDTVQGILMARIDGLPQKHRRLLRTASVLGRSMPRELLGVLWDDDKSIDSLLEDLQHWELIYKAPSEDKVSYIFKHALTQEVAYESLLSSRRQELHRRAAQVLEHRHADHLEDVYPQLVYHYPLAGDPGKTVHYLTLFAERAARNFAHAEAAKALREALVHVEQLPDATRDRRLIELLLALAESLLPLAAFPEKLELFEHYRERLEGLDDAALAGRYYFWLAHTHTYLGNQEATREYAEKAIQAAQEVSDDATEGKACYVLGRDGFWSGKFSDGIRNSLRAVVLLERTGEAWWQGQAHWVAGFNHYVLGQFQEAVQALERCCAIGEALDDYRLDASWSLGYFYASWGESQKGIEYCRRGVRTAQDPLNLAVSVGFLGYALLMDGEDLANAGDKLRQALAEVTQAGMQQFEGWFSVFVGEQQLATGDTAGALSSATHGLAMMQRAAFRYGTGRALHSLGRICLETGELSKARRNLEEARQLYEELQVPFLVGRVQLDEAQLAKLDGNPELAEQRLTQAQDHFNALGVSDYIDRARKPAPSDAP